MYLGIGAFALGIAAIAVGTGIAIAAGKKQSKSVTGGGIAWEAGE